MIQVNNQKSRKSAMGFGFSLLLVAVSFAQASRIIPSLQRKLEGLGPDEKVSVVVHLVERADLSLIPSSDKAARLSYLKRFASEKQAPVMVFVRSLGNKVSDTLSFWIINGFACSATRDAINAIASLPAVDFISDNQLPASEPASGSSAPPGPWFEWNLGKVNAPNAWNRGYTGQGSLVCIFDKGVQNSHETFTTMTGTKWRGPNLPEWWYSWFDALDPNTQAPIDEDGHGTHVAGLAVGGDGVPGGLRDIGVAFGAKYIACRSDDWASNKHLCFQWIASLASTPEHGDVAPDVVNCSWGFYYTNLEFWSDVENLRSLGIVPVFCIGNNDLGPYPWTPGDFPLTNGVGATDIDDQRANFSCRGPAPSQAPWINSLYWGRSDWTLIKPDLVAPGTDYGSGSEDGIVSAKFDDLGGYLKKWGTSMAAPHVTGAIALMLQASRQTWNYKLNYYDLYDLLLESANRVVGGPHPNNDYGWGRLDCDAAVSSVENYHLKSSSPTATGPNNGDHVAYGGGKWHLVYESGGPLDKYVRYTASTDNGLTWFSEANGPNEERIGRIGEGGSPALSVDSNGDAYVVWVDGSQMLYSRKPAASSTWSDPVVIYEYLGNVPKTPSLAVNATTHIGYVAFISEGISDKSVIYGWFDTQTPGLISTRTLDAGDVSNPSIGLSGSVAHVTWQKKPQGANPAIYYAFPPKWSVTQISQSPSVSCERPDLVVSPFNSNVGVIWEEFNGATNSTDIRFRRKVGSSWQTPLWVCQTSNRELRRPVIAADANRNYFFAAWADSFSQSPPQDEDWEVFISVNNGSGWGSPQNVSGHTLYGSKNPQIGYLSSQENILIAYGEGSSVPSLSSRYVPVYEIRTVCTPSPPGGGGGQSGELASQLSYQTALLCCYPHPFKNDATFEYEISSPVSASLKIYNVSGQVVKSLTEGPMAPGRYKVVWDGRDIAGRKVSSGIYFYRLVAGAYRKTNKLVVVR